MCVRECKMLWHSLALFCYEKLHFVILSESGDIQIAQANLLFFRRRTFAKVCGKWLCKSSHFIDLLLLLQMFVGWLLIEYQHIKGYENGYWGWVGLFHQPPFTAPQFTTRWWYIFVRCDEISFCKTGFLWYS